MRKSFSHVAAAAAALAGSTAPATPVTAIDSTPPPAGRLTREEFEAHMKNKLRESQIADKLEFWHGQAMLHLAAAEVPAEEAFELAMRLAEKACTFREWELWPTPEDVVAKHLKDGPK
jgi:hypothetical protein